MVLFVVFVFYKIEVEGLLAYYTVVLFNYMPILCFAQEISNFSSSLQINQLKEHRAAFFRFKASVVLLLSVLFFRLLDILASSKRKPDL